MSKNYSVRIESFDVSGYRSCVRTHVDLNVDLSALIGINGSGKTNVLQSLLLLKKLVNIKPFIRHRREEKKSNVCKMRAERVNDIETPGCMKLLSNDRTIARWSPVWVD